MKLKVFRNLKFSERLNCSPRSCFGKVSQKLSKENIIPPVSYPKIFSKKNFDERLLLKHKSFPYEV